MSLRRVLKLKDHGLAPMGYFLNIGIILITWEFFRTGVLKNLHHGYLDIINNDLVLEDDKGHYTNE